MFSHILFRHFHCRSMPGVRAPGSQSYSYGQWPIPMQTECRVFPSSSSVTVNSHIRVNTECPILFFLSGWSGLMLVECIHSPTPLNNNSTHFHRSVKYYPGLNAFHVSRSCGQLWGNQIVQGFMQSGPASLRRQRLYIFSRQTVLVPSCLLVPSGAFRCIWWKIITIIIISVYLIWSSYFNVWLLFLPVTIHHRGEPGFIISIDSLYILKGYWQVLLKCSPFQTKPKQLF